MHIKSTEVISYTTNLPNYITATRHQVDGGNIYKFHIEGHTPTSKMLITAGQHGDEPVGNTAALNILKKFKETQPKQNYTIITHLNPDGCDNLRASMPDGRNLNHGYDEGEPWWPQNQLLLDELQNNYQYLIDCHECHRKDLTDKHLMHAYDDPHLDKLIEKLGPIQPDITWVPFISKHAHKPEYQAIKSLRKAAMKQGTHGLVLEHNIPQPDIMENYLERCNNYTNLLNQIIQYHETNQIGA